MWRVYSAKRMCARAAEADTHTHRAVSRMRGINSCSVQQAWCVVCLLATSHHHHPARVPQESPWEWESQLPAKEKKTSHHCQLPAICAIIRRRCRARGRVAIYIPHTAHIPPISSQVKFLLSTHKYKIGWRAHHHLGRYELCKRAHHVCSPSKK